MTPQPVMLARPACLALLAMLALAGCDRERAPVLAPQAPMAQPASPPVTPTGEQLTIARACATDIERFCAGIPPRQGLIKQCMQGHVTELSAGCFDQIMAAVAAEQAP